MRLKQPSLRTQQGIVLALAILAVSLLLFRFLFVPVPGENGTPAKAGESAVEQVEQPARRP